jgi:DNA-binding NarL/FixJ family response regulator
MSMKKQMVAALIVTRTDDLQQGLGALLESLPGVKSVTVIRETTTALRWIKAHQPEIVLLDLALSGKDPRTLLDTVRSHSPGTKRVLLVNSLGNEDWVPQYAEAVLLKGVAPAAVVATITNLLPIKGENK